MSKNKVEMEEWISELELRIETFEDDIGDDYERITPGSLKFALDELRGELQQLQGTDMLQKQRELMDLYAEVRGAIVQMRELMQTLKVNLQPTSDPATTSGSCNQHVRDSQ